MYLIDFNRIHWTRTVSNIEESNYILNHGYTTDAHMQIHSLRLNFF